MVALLRQSNFHMGGNQVKDIQHDELVAKINEFTKLTKERALTEAEAEERELYRREYLRRIKISLKGNLDGVKYNKK